MRAGSVRVFQMQILWGVAAAAGSQGTARRVVASQPASGRARQATSCMLAWQQHAGVFARPDASPPRSSPHEAPQAGIRVVFCKRPLALPLLRSQQARRCLGLWRHCCRQALRRPPAVQVDRPHHQPHARRRAPQRQPQLPATCGQLAAGDVQSRRREGRQGCTAERRHRHHVRQLLLPRPEGSLPGE